MINLKQQKELLNIAKQAVEFFVAKGEIKEFTVTDKELNSKKGAFVTLHKNSELRGCIGLIINQGEPLWRVVRDMAIEAATNDSRFSPVSENELPELDYEISVLSEPKKIKNWQKIELGKHGVIVKKGSRSGVFLPQVATETNWSLEEFLSQLCEGKAGLKPDAYKNDPDVELFVFEAEVFSRNA